MQSDARTYANRQPFEPVEDAFDQVIRQPLKRVLSNDSPQDVLRVECRTNDGEPFEIELDSSPSQDVPLVWGLSRSQPSPAPSTYWVLDQTGRSVLVAAEARTEVELVQEANYLLHSIGGPHVQIIDVQAIRSETESGSLLQSVLRRVLGR